MTHLIQSVSSAPPENVFDAIERETGDRMVKGHCFCFKEGVSWLREQHEIIIVAMAAMAVVALLATLIPLYTLQIPITTSVPVSVLVIMVAVAATLAIVREWRHQSAVQQIIKTNERMCSKVELIAKQSYLDALSREYHEYHREKSDENTAHWQQFLFSLFENGEEDFSKLAIYSTPLIAREQSFHLPQPSEMPQSVMSGVIRQQVGIWEFDMACLLIKVEPKQQQFDNTPKVIVFYWCDLQHTTLQEPYKPGIYSAWCPTSADRVGISRHPIWDDIKLAGGVLRGTHEHLKLVR